jgi:hypothetical protein
MGDAVETFSAGTPFSLTEIDAWIPLPFGGGAELGRDSIGESTSLLLVLSADRLPVSSRSRSEAGRWMVPFKPPLTMPLLFPLLITLEGRDMGGDTFGANIFEGVRECLLD